MKVPIKPGLVFSIPVDESHMGIAQLLAKQSPIYYTVIYDILLDNNAAISPDAVANAEPILAGNFFTNFLRLERWTPLFIAKIPDIPFPFFKVVVSGKFHTVSWDRNIERPSTDEEASALEFRANHSAMVLETALKAHFGKGAWNRHFEPLKIENVRANYLLATKSLNR